MKAPLLLALAAFAAPVIAADTLTRVQIDSPRAEAIAARLEREGFDVLEGSVGPASLQVVASAESLERLRRMGLEYKVIARGRPLNDIQAEQAMGPGPDPVPPGYPDLAAVNAQLNARAATYPAICQVVNLTTTYGTPATAQGRHLFAAKISDNVAANEDEPTFLLIATHHAREVNSTTVALDTMDRLLAGYGIDQNITDLINKYEIWIAPVWNPDGYNHCFVTDNNWRKNRRNNGSSFGVDLNRNYPFGWSGACAGSTTASSDTYKGPSAGSEPETQTLLAFALDRHFTKVIDYHSYGRETLFEYACVNHPLVTFLGNEAAAISTASGYGGATRAPSAEGEHYESQLAVRGAYAFLTEIGTAFQPTYASAQAEAALVWPGNLYILNRPIPIAGHVTNALTGQPVVANITIQGVNFTNGETNTSRGQFGRYHIFVPAGTYTVSYSASGYVTAQRVVQVGAATETVVDVPLQPILSCPANCDASTVVPFLNINDFTCFTNLFASGSSLANCDASTIPPVLNVNDFTCFLNRFSVGCSAP
ncbi:MAG: carboxypeptidase regulatory-like domain-containing protein [Phycisphaerae bacterium]|nr:carboxypeptidase regulatory-like domain-containing protein [Phycisphaerae bacterium]